MRQGQAREPLVAVAYLEARRSCYRTADHRITGEHDSLGCSRTAACRDHERVTIEHWLPVSGLRDVSRLVDDVRRCDPLENGGACRVRQTQIERKNRITDIPCAPQMLEKRGTRGHGKTHEGRHVNSVGAESTASRGSAAHSWNDVPVEIRSTLRPWILGARPRTLPAAVVPVAIGAASAVAADSTDGTTWWRVVPALVVSLALQVGVNYANDYSDGVKGTDDVRVGPLRLVASGTKPASSVKCAAFLSFGVAAIAGLVLAALTSWWLIVVGLVAIASAWTYTGGPRPYGYAGLGELFVFVFFGLVATAGTTFVVCGKVTPASWWGGVASGCFACALLVVNNLRDIPTDARVGKRTLAVRIRDKATRQFFVALFVVAAATLVVLASSVGSWSLLGLLGIVAATPAIAKVLRGATGHDLVEVLGIVGRAQMLFGVSCAVGVALALG